MLLEREEAVKENEENFGNGYGDDEDDWEEKVEWDDDPEADESGDVRDEGDAYLEFLSQQVSRMWQWQRGMLSRL